jgi:hypothetical protein
MRAAERFWSVTAMAAVGARSAWTRGGWDHLRPWLEFRMAMPVGPLLCVIDGPTRGWPWATDAGRAQLPRDAAKAGVRRRFTPHQLGQAQAVELAHEGLPLTSSSANWVTPPSASPPLSASD